MKLLKFRLNNFRSFYHQTPWFHLAGEDKRNVTVIHCENGVGKTTILNSLIWLLYGKLTDDILEPEDIVNKQAISEANIGTVIECSVELFFEHLYKTYRIKRVKKVTKVAQDTYRPIDKISVIMQCPDENGQWLNIANYNDEIGRILPESLHSYFFFNGERIEWIQRPINRKEFAQAITLLVGDETYARAHRHLLSAQRKIEEELENIGDPETKDLYSDKAQLKTQLEACENTIHDEEKNLEGYSNERKQLSDQLLSLGGDAKGLEEQRKSLANDLDNTKKSLQENRKTLVNLTSDTGYKVFTSKAVDLFLSKVSTLRQSGMIPQPYKATFVRQLLENEQCICGTPLLKGGEPYTLVQSWLHKASLSEYEDTILKMEGIFEDLQRELPNIVSRFNNTQSLRMGYLKKAHDIEDELNHISVKLKDSDSEKVRKLESRLQEVTELIQDTSFKLGELSSRAKTLTQQIALKDQEILKRTANSAQERLVKRRIAACMLAIEELGARRNKLRNANRLDLEQRIDRIFREIAFKDYSVKLAEDYSLSLESSYGSVGQSTSESQIMSLSFIFAIMEQAREFAAKHELMGVDSSFYPLVIDSVFGNMGEAYQKAVAKYIPQLSSQSLVLVSSTQWNNHIEEQLRPFIGKEYVISFFTRKIDSVEVSITIGGTSYDLLKKSNSNQEYIKICEVPSHV